mgnify:FL=1
MTRETDPLRGLETKHLPFETRSGLGGDGRVEGYASLFETPDESGDVIAPGAFSASLARRRGGLAMLWQHDPAEPIGVWDEAAEDGRGLRVTGRILTEIRRGGEAAALLRAGAIDGLSIGYRTLRAQRAPGGGRRLLEIELWEVSLVTFPMLAGARTDAGRDGDETVGGDGVGLAEALRAARTLFQ